MNKTSVHRAKIVLKRIGEITARIDEREKAKVQLEKHIEKLKDKPSQHNLKKLNNLVQLALEKESNLARSQILESKRFKELNSTIDTLRKEHVSMEDQIDEMKESVQGYDKLKKHEERKQKALEKKTAKPRKKPNAAITRKVKALEAKYKKLTKKYSKNQLRPIKAKIDSLKRLTNL